MGLLRLVDSWKYFPLCCDFVSVKSGMFGLFVVFRFDFGARVLWEKIG